MNETKGELQPNREAREPFTQWLADREAKLCWSVDIKGIGAVSAFAVNTHMVIVQVWRDTMGIATAWEAYVAASDSNEVDATVTALDQHCFGGAPVQVGR